MPPRILVIDGDRASQRVLAIGLRQGGYEVKVAADGPEGLKALAAEQPDLVVMDVVLPRVNGYEVARSIRARQGTHHVPILLLATGKDLQDNIRGLRAGADDFLVRPFDPAELLARVRSILVRFAPRAGSGEAERGPILGFYGARGGAGTTTLAINAAIALQRTLGRNVVLVDGKLQFGDHRVFLDIGIQQRTIIDVIAASSIDVDLLSKIVVHHDSGIDVLLSAPSPESSELVKAEHMPQILHQLSTAYDYVIVDIDPRLDELSLQVLDVSATVFVVMTADLPSLKNVRLLLGTMSNLGYDAEKIRLVLNRSTAMTGINVRNVETALERPISHQILNDYQRAISALNSGAPFMITKPESRLGRSVLDFAIAIDSARTTPVPVGVSGATVVPARK
jgi:pilus assembly protein CpaE